MLMKYRLVVTAKKVLWKLLPPYFAVCFGEVTAIKQKSQDENEVIELASNNQKDDL